MSALTREGAAPQRVRARRAGGLAAARVIGLYGLTLLAVVTLVFLLPRLMPGNPLSALQDPESGLFLADPQVRARVEAYYGLDQPLWHQYGQFLAGLLHGDLGWSIARNAPVSTLIARHLPWTLLLSGTALALSSLVSFGAGISAAWRRGRLADRALIVGLATTRTIPEYALAALLLVAFGVALPLFPLYGAHTPFADYSWPLAAIGDVAAHLALPLTALTLALLGSKFLLVRNTAVSTLGEDYMLLARAKGLPRRLLKYRHAGRNALLPFLTVLGVQAGFALGGSLFVESVFAYPGMGVLLEEALAARDYPVLQATFLVLAVVVLVANLILELVYRRLDPRVGAE